VSHQIPPSLGEFCPFVVSFVPPAKQVNAKMAVVVAEFATPVAVYNIFWHFFLISHLQVQSKNVLQLHVSFAAIATFSFFSALFG
jgi:hypothetical protein